MDASWRAPRVVLYWAPPMPVWSRRKLAWLVPIGLALAAAPPLEMSLERRLIYFPDRILADTPAQDHLGYEDVWATTSDGIRVHGWAMPPAGRDAAWLLYSHGNGGNVSLRPAGVAPLVHRGLGVLLYDYRGYGRSEGRPSEQGTYADGEAMLAEAIRRAGDARRVVLYGESLGGGVSYELARRHPELCGLITISTFTSIPDMVRVLYPIPGLSWLVRTRYDNLAKARDIRVPRLVIHGTDDELVPFRMGEALRDATSPPAEFLAIRGAHHNDTFSTGGDEYYDAVQRFVGNCLVSRR